MLEKKKLRIRVLLKLLDCVSVRVESGDRNYIKYFNREFNIKKYQPDIKELKRQREHYGITEVATTGGICLS